MYYFLCSLPIAIFLFPLFFTTFIFQPSFYFHHHSCSRPHFSLFSRLSSFFISCTLHYLPAFHRLLLPRSCFVLDLFSPQPFLSRRVNLPQSPILSPPTLLASPSAPSHQYLTHPSHSPATTVTIRASPHFCLPLSPDIRWQDVSSRDKVVVVAVGTM